MYVNNLLHSATTIHRDSLVVCLRFSGHIIRTRSDPLATVRDTIKDTYAICSTKRYSKPRHDNIARASIFAKMQFTTTSTELKVAP